MAKSTPNEIVKVKDEKEFSCVAIVSCALPSRKVDAKLWIKLRFLLLCCACYFSFQEDSERTQINVLAVQAITSLVLSAMTIPLAGNPAVSCLEQQPRNKALKALDTRYFQLLIFLLIILGSAHPNSILPPVPFPILAIFHMFSCQNRVAPLVECMIGTPERDHALYSTIPWGNESGVALTNRERKRTV